MEFFWGHHPGLDIMEGFLDHAIVKKMKEVKNKWRVLGDREKGKRSVFQTERGTLYCFGGKTKQWNYSEV